MVHKERKSLTANALEGVDIDNTLGSLVKLADVLWIENAKNDNFSLQTAQWFCQWQRAGIC
jgi:hypothetical protein